MRSQAAEQDSVRAAQLLAAQSATIPTALPSGDLQVTRLRSKRGTGRPGKTWVNRMKRKDLQRAVILAEVFDRPRCFDT
jgi:hypothetical protein